MTKNKIECLNPNTGRKINIDSVVYELFSKAIYDTLKKEKEGIAYTEMLNGIKKCFKEQKTAFSGSLGWYAVTVKHDMVANNIIETWMENGTN
jgi:hypothetical protein